MVYFYTANNIAYSAPYVTDYKEQQRACADWDLTVLLSRFQQSLLIQAITVEFVDKCELEILAAWRTVAIIYAIIGLRKYDFSTFC